MLVALIGITGQVGSRVASELLLRGHEVLGLARDISDVTPQPHLTLVTVDANAPEQTTPLITGSDAVVSATRFRTSHPAALLEAVRASHVPRLMVVGALQASFFLQDNGSLIVQVSRQPRKKKGVLVWPIWLHFKKSMRSTGSFCRLQRNLLPENAPHTSGWEPTNYL
jgi:putative NADH-flavin reductase